MRSIDDSVIPAIIQLPGNDVTKQVNDQDIVCLILHLNQQNIYQILSTSLNNVFDNIIWKHW